MAFLGSGMTRILLITNAGLPPAAVATAYWASTWGWNSDGKLAGETFLYLVASYVIFFVVGIFVYELRPFFSRIRLGISARPGLLAAIWGVYVSFASALLAHLFDSEALWFGSIALAYLGFVVAVIAVIRTLAGKETGSGPP